MSGGYSAFGIYEEDNLIYNYRANKNFIEVFTDRNRAVPDEKIIAAADEGKVLRID